MFKVTFNDLVIIAMEIHLFPCRTQKLSPITPEVVGGCPLRDRVNAKFIWSVGQGVKTPPFHGGNTGSNPVRTIYLEDYPSPAEGNGLENRQACKSVRGFESHILLIIKAGWSS